MELSRIKVLYGGLILQLLFTFTVPLPYNKYGRKCSDIGCLSSQVCVMAYDTCTIGQREGAECGRFPTCKKNTDAGLAAGPSENAQDLHSDRPNPPKSAPPSDDDVLSSLGLIPNNPTNNGGGSSNRPSGSGGYANPYPSVPSPNQPQQPYYPPQPAPSGGSNQYGGGDGNNYYGGGGAGNNNGGGSRRPGQFDGSGGNIVVPTPKPAAPAGGGFFSGILSGVQNAVGNAIKQQVGTYINQRLGIGPAAGAGAGGQAGGAGGLGSFLDARNFIDSRNLGGLFSERKPSGSGSSQTGPYPVTVDQRSQVYSSNAAPNQRASGEQSGGSRGSGTPAPYGWKLD
ncbi:translation initiation factor IF-2-like [Uranotaenia lowii]|uniref:translation initiation factor IF-2-like n=1 Tax=Uranotaenia lowii TaxID=190385 RepID=UPI002478BB54|nr:translation initiation factor IF-2-like [Uranotaenia lowii]XP_055610469.1 translation initiation factor IF-2-like [Uranotaenia lowii]XP_055610470.1 translation initiation factor IF-2-like [Uranotaenia lowii]